jgi:uncharacterized protein YjbI with pentapeptide repeats
MEARLRTWWQRARKPLEIISIIAICISVIVLIIVIIQLYGTGFDGYDKVSTTHTVSGSSSGIVTRTEEYQPGKTLWDWLQLLIIPAVLAAGGYLFNLTVSRNEQKSTQVRDQTEREIASDNQQEAALQAYIDKMSELLLNKLRESAEDAEVRKIARVRTLTVLPRLDKVRKKSVLQFLYEAGLLDKDKYIVDLKGANLSLANLSLANLTSAHLSFADLSEADLSFAHLTSAHLTSANLTEADLSYANLSGANLSLANLTSAHLSLANLTSANLSFAHLTSANLSFADLSKADLSFAHLTSADLSLANLSHADLSYANLSGANLSGANLSRANLSGANLSGAEHVTTGQLEQALSLYGAIMPDGSKHL